jgi:hypothetical protein
MKRLWYVSVILIPLIVLALFTGCPSKGSAGSGTYYIKATIDGTIWEFLHGITDVEPEPFGTFFTTGTVGTELNAQTTAGDSTVQPDSYVSFFIDSSSTSPAVYTISDFIDADIRLNDNLWEFTVITLTISKYDSVGGTIEGTFSGDLIEYQGSATMTVTNGQFKVIRAVDNAW